MEWQPIETAPKDEWVLVWLDADECHAIAEFSEGRWFDDQGIMHNHPPSFWMPLPPPPQGK